MGHRRSVPPVHPSYRPLSASRRRPGGEHVLHALEAAPDGEDPRAPLVELTRGLSSVAFWSFAALCACGGPSPTASPQPLNLHSTAERVHIACTTFVDRKHSAENWLNGIDDRGEIAGYYGNFAAGSSVAYVVAPPYRSRDYRYGFLGSVFTATGNAKTIAGYYRNEHGKVFGAISSHGTWTTYESPRGSETELLGMNASGTTAVGFGLDRSGKSHGFWLNIASARFHPVAPKGSSGAAVSGINDRGDVVGYATTANGTVEGFLLRRGGYAFFSYPGSAGTAALGIDRRDEIVGLYRDSAGATHGFLLRRPTKNPQWESYDDPHADGLTVLSGIDDRGGIVGNYRDSAGHTHGLLCAG